MNLLGDFLRARRELVSPAEHGLPDSGRRRVPGLRREEVAMLAGVSAEYYVRLERGRDRNPSPQVLDAIGRVLGLDDDSRAYVDALLAGSRPEAPEPERVGAAVLAMIDAMGVPAFVLGRFMDVLAANRTAELLHCGSLPANMVRHVFLDAAARELYPDWEDVAAESAASLRAQAVGHLDDDRLTRLVGELSLKSDDFRRLWSRHDVMVKTSGRKRINSPVIGDVTLHWEGLQVTSAPGQLIVAYSADAGTPAADGLQRLAEHADTRT